MSSARGRQQSRPHATVALTSRALRAELPCAARPRSAPDSDPVLHFVSEESVLDFSAIAVAVRAASTWSMHPLRPRTSRRRASISTRWEQRRSIPSPRRYRCRVRTGHGRPAQHHSRLRQPLRVLTRPVIAASGPAFAPSPARPCRTARQSRGCSTWATRAAARLRRLDGAAHSATLVRDELRKPA